MVVHAFTEKDDPEAKVILGRISLSPYQLTCLRDDWDCPLTPRQYEIMRKFEGKKLSVFPAGWDAFIRPDKVYEYVFEEPAPKPTKDKKDNTPKKKLRSDPQTLTFYHH